MNSPRSLVVLLLAVCLAACSGKTSTSGDAEAGEDGADAALDSPAEDAGHDGEAESVIEADTEADAEADAEAEAGPPVCGDGIIEGDEQCDDGNDTPGDGCEPVTCRYTCEDDAQCRNTNVCDGDETCDGTTHTCTPGTRQPDGFVCEAGPPRMICLGGTCFPSHCADGFVDPALEDCEPPGTGDCDAYCRWRCNADDDCADDGLVCNGAEACDLVHHECVHQDPPADGTVCSTTPRRICIAQTCQASICGDGYVDPTRMPAAEECEDGNWVSGDGCEPDDCRFSCHDGTECADGLPCTDDDCNASTHVCEHPASPPGTVCRPAVPGGCDVEETCDGSAATCPDDQVEPSGTVCRDAADVCDVAEACSGVGPACPPDAFQPAWLQCRATAGVCDVAENCTGSSAACPADGFESAAVECRPAAAACDAAESCDGMSADCPADGFQPAGAPCDDGHDCTDPDSCDGAGACSGTPIDDLHDIVAVAAGSQHTCAVLAGGGVKCWGYNYYGQLGDGTTTNRITPVEMTGLSANVVAITAGGYHTCALTSAGTVKCWGYNGYGQLGDGTTTNGTGPVDVFGLSSGVVAVSAGFSFTCALTSAGAVKCWGYNGYGQMGNGTWTDAHAPTPVSGLSSGVTAIAAGGSHACALTSTGAVKCWGYNYGGQIGDGTTIDRYFPVDVSGLSSGVLAIAAGANHTCAVTGTGGAKCWGYNYQGQLGDGTTTERHLPTDVSGLSSGVASISAGLGLHTCAVTTSGGAKCWGYNHNGQLGDGTTTDRSSPVDVSGLSSGVAAIAEGGTHTCALTTAGRVECWGDNGYGQLGGSTAATGSPRRLFPADVVGLTSGVSAISTGGIGTCALLDTGGAKCWGYNYYGQVGDGTTTDRHAPMDVVGLSSGVSWIGVGSQYSTCAIMDAGGGKCWGYNSSGQLGDGTTTNRSTPVDVLGLPSGIVAIIEGGNHACALTAVGGVKCWGNNSYGQLGDGTNTNRSSPVDVVGLTSGVAAIGVGGLHACALLVGGSVKCWGSNSNGQLGDGTKTNRNAPVDVLGLSSGVTAIDTESSHTCALMSTGGVKCWGYNGSGQLGDGTRSDGTAPIDVVGLSSGVVAVAAGGSHTCVLMDDGSVKCWGENGSGQLGDGTTTGRVFLGDVLGLPSGVTAIDAGGNHTCVLLDTGGMKCWGDDNYGETGGGDVPSPCYSPQPVLCM